MRDGSARSGAPPGYLPVGTRARQAWRSPMRRALDALLLDVGSRTGSLVNGVAGFVAWHDALSRRAEPWSGWPPMTFAFRGGAADGAPDPSADPGPASADRVPRRLSRLADATRSGGAVAAGSLHASTVSPARASAARAPRPVPAPARPGVRLAGWQLPTRPRSRAPDDSVVRRGWPPL